MNKQLLTLMTILMFISLASAVVITDTTFFASTNNYTIFVDSLELENVTVTATSIQFFNINSSGANLTNTNATYDAVASLIGLPIGMNVLNVNTDTILFTSSASSQNFNATFTPGQTIRITNTVTLGSNARTQCLELVTAFGGYAVLIGLLGTIIFLAAIMVLLRTGFIGNGSFNGNILFGSILTVVAIAVLVIVSIVIFSVLCSTL